MYLHLKPNNSIQEINNDTTGISLSQAQFDSIMFFIHNNLEALKHGCIIIDPVSLTCSIDTVLLGQLQLLEVQKAKEIEIRQACAHAIELIANPYPQQERDTWFKQAAEAEMWTANNTAATPMIDAIVSARQINDAAVTKTSIVNNILVKRDMFNIAVGSVIGKQQGLLAKVYDTNATVASVLDITW